MCSIFPCMEILEENALKQEPFTNKSIVISHPNLLPRKGFHVQHQIDLRTHTAEEKIFSLL